MSHPERRAAFVLLALAVLGQALRVWITRPGEAPGQVHLLGPESPISPAAHRDSAVQASRPLGPSERIDLDRATIRQIERLPQVGPGLARRIVGDRQEHGPFGSLEGFDRVPGVGPGTLDRLRGHVSFSSGTAGGRYGGGAVTDPFPPFQPPGVPPDPLDINTADSASLEHLPGLGPFMAGRIVAWRERHGRFATVDDLVKVGGIGPGTLGRVRDLLSAAP